MSRPAERSQRARFAVCVKNAGYEASLERNKIYQVVVDAEAERDGDIRVIDESGEDYLYPAGWFVALELPMAVKRSVRAATEGVSNKPMQRTGSARR